MSQTVAHYIDTRAFGGAEKVLLDLLAGHDRARWRPVLYHHAEPALRPLVDGARASGVELREVPRVRGGRGLVAMPAFWAAVRSLRPAVFHAHLNWPLACSGGILAAWAAGAPVVATAHLFGPLPSAPSLGVQRRLVTGRVDCYVAVSEGVARRLRGVFAIPPERVRVVPNGVDLGAHGGARADGRLRDAVGAAPGQPVVLTLARLTGQKGHRFLLRAAAEVPEAHFAFAGEGPDRAGLEREAAALGLGGRVHFLGPRPDPAALLADCDVAVLPSLYEGLPLAVLEAMAAGKPVVASAIDGVDEAVVHGATGLLVPPADPRALAEAIRALLADPAWARRLGAAGAARAHAQFSVAAMVRGVEAVYDTVTAARGAGGGAPRGGPTPGPADGARRGRRAGPA